MWASFDLSSISPACSPPCPRPSTPHPPSPPSARPSSQPRPYSPPLAPSATRCGQRDLFEDIFNIEQVLDQEATSKLLRPYVHLLDDDYRMLFCRQ